MDEPCLLVSSPLWMPTLLFIKTLPLLYEDTHSEGNNIGGDQSCYLNDDAPAELPEKEDAVQFE